MHAYTRANILLYIDIVLFYTDTAEQVHGMTTARMDSP